jgi:hypothetical protein
MVFCLKEDKLDRGLLKKYYAIKKQKLVVYFTYNK